MVGLCVGCGDGIEEGEFCYWIGEQYFCRSCIERSALIAGEEYRMRGGFRRQYVRQIGCFREEEMVFVARSNGAERRLYVCRDL